MSNSYISLPFQYVLKKTSCLIILLLLVMGCQTSKEDLDGYILDNKPEEVTTYLKEVDNLNGEQNEVIKHAMKLVLEHDISSGKDFIENEYFKNGQFSSYIVFLYSSLDITFDDSKYFFDMYIDTDNYHHFESMTAILSNYPPEEYVEYITDTFIGVVETDLTNYNKPSSSISDIEEKTKLILASADDMDPRLAEKVKAVHSKAELANRYLRKKQDKNITENQIRDYQIDINEADFEEIEFVVSSMIDNALADFYEIHITSPYHRLPSILITYDTRYNRRSIQRLKVTKLNKTYTHRAANGFQQELKMYEEVSSRVIEEYHSDVARRDELKKELEEVSKEVDQLQQQIEQQMGEKVASTIQ